VTSVEQRLAECLARGEEVMAATVVRTGGEPPSRPGAKLLVSRAGPLAGTLGCSEFDAAALADAATALDEGTPRLRTYHHDLGTVEVHLEPYPARPTLVVAGATPVAAAVLEWASAVGFRTVLVESRAERLRGGRWAADVVATDLDSLEASVAGDELYAVLTDHDAPDVVDVCRRLLPHRPRHLGLMGSRRHTSHHLEALRRAGASEAEMAAIRTPVGLDLGGRTAPEIALSVVAGMVAARHGATGGWKDGSRPASAPAAPRAGRHPARQEPAASGEAPATAGGVGSPDGEVAAPGPE
jgi:xanthine dehydrogenase accessory factor